MAEHPASGQPRATRSGFAATVRAVLWSFIGIRRKSEYEKDAASLNPVHVIITGLLAAALFVVVLIVIVHLVVR
ncbi:MAG: DUF2970 domain-containing protein [Burkholderiaceae bacterium]